MSDLIHTFRLLFAEELLRLAMHLMPENTNEKIEVATFLQQYGSNRIKEYQESLNADGGMLGKHAGDN